MKTIKVKGTRFQVDDAFDKLDSDIQKRAVMALETGVYSSVVVLGDELDELSKKFRKLNSDRQKKIFVKDTERGYYTNKQDISEEQVEMLVDVIGDKYNVFNFFNKNGYPWGIKKEEAGEISEIIKSRDIYASMNRNRWIISKFSFEYYLDGEDRLFEAYTIENGRISMQDIVNFM